MSLNQLSAKLVQDLAGAWADELGTTISKCLGNDNSGTAFLTGCNRVIKLTSSEPELHCSFMLIGTELNHVCSIYAVKVFGNRIYGVFQEYIEIEPAKSAFIALSQYINEVLELDIMEFFHSGSSLAEISCRPEIERRLVEHILSARIELDLKGIATPNISEENVGTRHDGGFVIFDISDNGYFELSCHCDNE